MDHDQKLVQFMDAVNRSTDEEIAKAEARAEQKAQERLAEAEARCRADAAREIAAAKANITAKYQKRASQVGYRGRTALLSRRQMLLMQLFADLREKLLQFTESKDYLPWLEKLLSAHQPEEGAVILLREADLPYSAALQKAAGVPCEFRADRSIGLGGLSVLSADGRRCENHTLDEAYSSQLRNFYRNHKIDGGDE